MDKNLQNIFESITPDNIRNEPIIKDAMAIFIETLSELSKESIDIRNAFENELIKEQLQKTYLDDLYNVVKSIELNEKLLAAIDTVNESYNDISNGIDFIDKTLLTNISSRLNAEHFLTFKSYKENKGKVAGIKYIYELISNFLGIGDDGADFIITESETPFDFKVEGSLPTAIYDAVVFPLAHPVGFTYNFNRYISNNLLDYFPEININYVTNILSIRTLDTNGVTTITDFITNPSNNLKVTKINDSYNNGNKIKTVTLNDNRYLVQTTTSGGQTWVTEYNGTEETEYASQSSLYVEYNLIVETAVTDNIDAIVDFNIGTEGTLVLNYGVYDFNIGDFNISETEFIDGRSENDGAQGSKLFGETQIGAVQHFIGAGIGDFSYVFAEYIDIDDDDLGFGVYRENAPGVWDLVVDNNVAVLSV